MSFVMILTLLVPIGLLVLQFSKPEILRDFFRDRDLLDFDRYLSNFETRSIIATGLIIIGYLLPLLFVILSIFSIVDVEDSGYFVLFGAFAFVAGLTIVIKVVAQPLMIILSAPFVAIFELLFKKKTGLNYPGFGKSLIVDASVLLFLTTAAILASSSSQSGILYSIGYWITQITTIVILNVLEIGTFAIMIVLTLYAYGMAAENSEEDSSFPFVAGFIALLLTLPAVYISTYVSEAYIVYGGIQSNHLFLHGLTSSWLAPDISDLEWMKVLSEGIGSTVLFMLSWIKVFFISLVILIDDIF